MAQDASKLTKVGLRVLALHGEGLRGLGTISVVDELCSQIAQQNHQTRYPAPCQLFDVICGTGIGAFIAILLGRYSLDISRCKQVYMDLMDFVEERRQTRVFPSRSVSREDIQCFMEMLIKEEGWSDTMHFPVSGNKPRCRHVCVVQQPRSHGYSSTAEVCHGFEAHSRLANPMTECIEQKTMDIGDVVAKATVYPVDGWVPVLGGKDHDDGTTEFYFHESVLIAIEEISVVNDPVPVISFIASIGPPQCEQSIALEIPQASRSPAQWVAEKTSPIRSAIMWPLRATLKTFTVSEVAPVSDQPCDYTRRESAVHLPKVTVRSDAVAFDSASTLQKKLRRIEASKRLHELLTSSSGRSAFHLCTITSSIDDDWEDTVDLKEIRSRIRDTIGFMKETGLLQEAARQFGSP